MDPASRILEMLIALKLSLRQAWRPLMALFATLSDNTALTAILIGAKTFVQSNIQEGNVSHDVVASRKFVSFNAITSLPAWAVPVSYDTGMEEALDKAYESACDRFDFMAVSNGSRRLRKSDSCATVNFSPTSAGYSLIPNSTIVKMSPGRGKVIYTTRSNDVMRKLTGLDISVFTQVVYRDSLCGTFNANFQLIDATKAGLTSSPKTVSTKCLLASGEMVSLSTTIIRFTVPNREMFSSVATSIFGNQNELVPGLQESVDNNTLMDLPVDEVQMQRTVMEVKISGTEITALICAGSRQDITEARAMDPDISRLLTNKGLNPAVTNTTMIKALHHLPSIPPGKSPVFSIPKVLNASWMVSDYFASLSQSFVVDWDESVLFVAFDTVEILKEYQLLRWLFYAVIGVMVSCIFFWAGTKFWVEDPYKQLLYFAVSNALVAAEADVSPRLHRFNPMEFEFEDRRIVSSYAKEDS
ncbi:hypothetical protein BGZ95_011318 [Linnemannia exigua]|uniref:Transmembrane protein n=1 Tax=Linnemannia exigua TaxID=604196 RepID=A0AAD4DJX6_9FUNG|nr:hypothetical protein BGZ95_011318 [Linnemannia exigua]